MDHGLQGVLPLCDAGVRGQLVAQALDLELLIGTVMISWVRDWEAVGGKGVAVPMPG